MQVFFFLIAATFSYHVTSIYTDTVNIYSNTFVLFVSIFSLGCGIGYGYLHRIPTRPVQPNAENKSVLQSPVTSSSEELVASDTEVQVNVHG